MVLSREDNEALSHWQRKFALSWAETSDPWRGSLEADVIRLLRPPLNGDHNETHPFHHAMQAARKRFKTRAT